MHQHQLELRRACISRCFQNPGISKKRCECDSWQDFSVVLHSTQISSEKLKSAPVIEYWYWRCLEQINAGRDTAAGSGANYKFLTVNNFTHGLSHQA